MLSWFTSSPSLDEAIRNYALKFIRKDAPDGEHKENMIDLLCQGIKREIDRSYVGEIQDLWLSMGDIHYRFILHDCYSDGKSKRRPKSERVIINSQTIPEPKELFEALPALEPLEIPGEIIDLSKDIIEKLSGYAPHIDFEGVRQDWVRYCTRAKTIGEDDDNFIWRLHKIIYGIGCHFAGYDETLEGNLRDWKVYREFEEKVLAFREQHVYTTWKSDD